MLVNVFAHTAGILIFLFIFWKRLKEDYASELIFKSSFAILFLIFVLVFLGGRLLAGGFFYPAFFGAVLGVLFSTFVNKLKFYETLEAGVISLLPWAGFTFLGHSVNSQSFSSFGAFLTVLALIFIFYFLDTSYKNFTWYKSGRIGFAGVAILILIFLIRVSLAIGGVGVLSFVGVYEVWIAGFALLGFSVMMVFLAVNQR